MNILGFESSGISLLVGEGADMLDYLPLKENGAELDGLFFNSSRQFERMNDISKKKPKKKKKK